MEENKIEAERLASEEVFPGGPTKSQIESWKAQYGKIYCTKFSDNEVFIWRVLSRLEFKELAKIPGSDGLYREERICERCILWPEGYNHVAMATGKAGIPSVLADNIMEKSGWMPVEEPTEL